MKLVILAGGKGTRLEPETTVIPKPMVKIGSLPILLHIMYYYSSFNVKEFIILLGHKGHLIQQYFLDNFKSTKHHSKVEFPKTYALGLKSPYAESLIETHLELAEKIYHDLYAQNVDDPFIEDIINNLKSSLKNRELDFPQEARNMEEIKLAYDNLNKTSKYNATSVKQTRPSLESQLVNQR